ncbi:MAG: alkaline phosphatase family protein, partial [Planctomycetia bacterium]
VALLDEMCEPLLDAAKKVGARVWVVSENGHCDVEEPVYLNRILRAAGLLTVRSGPFGETIDYYASRAFAVVDHQLAHVYVADPDDVPQTVEALAEAPGVGRVYAGDERAEIGLLNERSGEVVATSQPNAWFAYPYWLDERQRPDFATTVDIHRKPGFDPCEMFFDPALWLPVGRVMQRLMQKRLGFRTLFDVVPTDAGIVRGSHGLPAVDPLDQPLFIGDGPPPAEFLKTADVRDLVLQALDLA